MSGEPISQAPQQEPAVTSEAARELTDQIREQVERAWKLIEQAYLTRAWAALDYASWDDYCAAEFDRARIRIPREERSEVVASLREIGMSTRAIAAATGLSVGATHAAMAGVQNRTPDLVVGLDDKAYKPKPTEREPLTPPDTGEVQAESVDSEPDSRRTPRRTPITESFDKARFDVVKKAEALARLAADDRFDGHAEQLAHRFRSDLLRARDTLQAVIDRLPELSDRPEEG